RNGPLQACLAAFAKTARNAGKCDRQVGEKPAFRRDAEDVQAVADLHFLQVAEIGVELLERGILAVGCGDAGIMVEPDVAHQIENLPRKQLDPPRIATGSL